jgi:transposase
MARRTPPTPPASRSLSPKAARQRRLPAARLFQQGLPQAEIARRLGVSRQTASRWHARWLQGGRAGLAGPGRWGRPSRLSDHDWRRIEQALLAGAEAHGFDTDLWTLPRVAEVIWRLTGVSYHPGHAKQGAWLCFLDESGASLTPPVRRTWAPAGHTPSFGIACGAASAS